MRRYYTTSEHSGCGEEGDTATASHQINKAGKTTGAPKLLMFYHASRHHRFAACLMPILLKLFLVGCLAIHNNTIQYNIKNGSYGSNVPHEFI